MKHLKIAMLLISMATANSDAFAAGAEGTWPSEMRDHALPKQGWVLVIPAERTQSGSIRVWDRADPWNARWLVPKSTPDGTRTVAVNGDAEDRRSVSAEEIDQMHVAALSALAQKYGATAIAVPVIDESGNVAVAAWAKGGNATWSSQPTASADSHDLALTMIDELFSGRQTDVSANAGVTITGQRYNALVGVQEYRLEGPREVLVALEKSPNIVVTGKEEGASPALHIATRDGRSVEAVLDDLGIAHR